MTCSSSCGHCLSAGWLAVCLSSAALHASPEPLFSPISIRQVDYRSDSQWPIGADLGCRPNERGTEICMIGSTPFRVDVRKDSEVV
ncbi:hypothetical protein LY78DRAFT_660928 [Colletotrichum sublineola]|nr:hypothetical protein LY78DRAFT_660928 [Colletotrichum sublineola]